MNYLYIVDRSIYHNDTYVIGFRDGQRYSNFPGLQVYINSCLVSNNDLGVGEVQIQGYNRGSECPFYFFSVSFQFFVAGFQCLPKGGQLFHTHVIFM